MVAAVKVVARPNSISLMIKYQQYLKKGPMFCHFDLSRADNNIYSRFRSKGIFKKEFYL